MIKTRDPRPMLDALESFVLSASDEDVLSVPPEHAAAAASEVRAIAARALQRRAAPSRRRATGRATGSPGRLIEFLRGLAATSPELSPHLAATFAAGKSPSQDEVEAVAVELLKARVERGPGRKKRGIAVKRS